MYGNKANDVTMDNPELKLLNLKEVKSKLEVEGIDYVVCPICHGHFIRLDWHHLRKHGYTTNAEFLADYPNITKLVSENYSCKVRNQIAKQREDPDFVTKQSRSASKAAKARLSDPIS